MKKTTSNINVSIIDGIAFHATMSPYIGLQLKPQSHVLEVGFPSVNQGKGSSLPLRDCLSRVLGTVATAPKSIRAGPHEVD